MSEGKKKDPLIEWLFILIGVILLYVGISHVFGAVIAKWWWAWQGLKAEALGVLWESGDVQYIRAMTNQDIQWSEVTFLQSWDLASRINLYFLIPLGGIIGYCAWEIAKANPLKNLKNKHSMDSLIRSESSIWPHMQPIMRLNLIEASTEKGPWASSQNPVEFAMKHKLLKDGMELDKEKTTKVFTAQLSQVWSGTESLPPIFKAFFAIFAAHGNWDEKNPKYKNGKKEARDGINKLAASFYRHPKRLDYSWVDDLIARHKDHPAVVEITNKHAYTHTVMMSLLEYARRNGVLASSEFFWLRATNRMLWYSLNNVGRNVAWTEVAGIYGHWLAEKIAETALVRPYVQKAVEAYADGLKNIKITQKTLDKYKKSDEKN